MWHRKILFRICWQLGKSNIGSNANGNVKCFNMNTIWFSKISESYQNFKKDETTSWEEILSQNMTWSLALRNVTRLFQIVTRFWRIFENRLLVNLESQLFRTSFQFFRQEFLLTEVFWHLVDLDSLEHFESSHDTAWFSKIFRKLPKFWKVRNSILCTSGNILSQNMTWNLASIT
jgi:hypothetical protein